LWDIFGKNQVVQGIEKPHTKSLPNTYWYLLHWTFVRIKLMKSTKYNNIYYSEHMDSGTDDLNWLSALPLVNCINIGKSHALNFKSSTSKGKIKIAPISQSYQEDWMSYWCT
jgi:hypothetical protein